MISKSVLEALETFVQAENIHIQESMAAHTTFRVGGPADCLVEIEDAEQLRQVQHYLLKINIKWYS